MNRKEFIYKAALLGAGASIAPKALFAQNNDRLVILHTNDWHSHIDPFPVTDKKYPGLGGAAKRAALIKDIRAQNKHVLLLDSGDIFQGTPYFNYYGGELEFKLMSEMGYDYATLGNHDFDAGIGGLVKQLAHARFNFLCANYDFSNTLLDGKVNPYAISNKGKFKIGIFGIGIELEGLVPKKLYGEIKYKDPIESANETASLLKEKGCNLIICLSHLGYTYEDNKVSDTILAKMSRNIDLILGGHTHTFLSYPQGVFNKDGKEIFINQTGWAGVNLGRIDYEAHRANSSQILGFNYLNIL